MRERLLDRQDILTLVRRRTVLLDGAFGTMLMAEGLQSGDVPEAWNLNRPEVVRSIHKRYFEAGADVVLTNSFGGNRLKLEKADRADEVVRLNRLAAELATAVRPADGFVAGDVGPSGELVAPVGSLDAGCLEDVFAEQAEALISGGVDLIVIETFFSLEEALAALRGVRKVGPCPVFVSMTYESKDRGFFTLMGETPERCTKTLEDEGADGVGANCTIGSREMIPLARILRENASLPILVQPNAGKPILENGKTVYRQTPEEFVEDILTMVQCGVNVVGGCCGTTPAFISAVHRRLHEP